MVGKDFVLAGKAIFTIKVPEWFQEKHGVNSHYTFQVRHKEGDERYRETWFVSLLVGPENTDDYCYVGILDEVKGELVLTKKSRFSNETFPIKLFKRVAKALWDNRGEDIAEAGFQLHHIGRCGRCGRPLTVPESIETGIGPICAGGYDDGGRVANAYSYPSSTTAVVAARRDNGTVRVEIAEISGSKNTSPTTFIGIRNDKDVGEKLRNWANENSQ